MTCMPLNVLDGAVATSSPVAVAMGALLMGLLAATTLALVLGAERRSRRRDLVIALNPRQTTVPRPREGLRFA